MLIAFKLKLALACVAGLAGPLAVAPLLSDAGFRGGASGAPRPGSVSCRAPHTAAPGQQGEGSQQQQGGTGYR